MNKRFKQILMLVLAVALILPQIGIAQKASAVDASDSNVIYDMQNDAKLVAGAFDSTDNLQKSGDVTFNVTDNAGVKSIEISGRTANWNGVDVLTAPIKAVGGATFHLQVKGHIPADATIPDGDQMLLGKSNDGYNYLKTTDGAVAGNSFTLDYIFDYATLSGYVDKSTNIRIQDTKSAIDKFVIDSIIITSTGATPTPVLYDMQNDAKLVAGAFDSTDNLQKSGDITFNVTDNAGVKTIEISGRTANWNGVDVLTAPIKAVGGATFHLQVKGHIPADATIPDGDQMLLGKSNDGYNYLKTTDGAVAGDSFTLDYIFDYATLSGYVDKSTNIRIQDTKSAIDKFVIDSIIITSTGTTPTTPTTPSDEVVVASTCNRTPGSPT
ncbi:hypothetical protein RE628_00835 [Paenibacillus sp. D2_2]|uniref:hypothetical protein n=1 Tax=Paenibacillus sp. D2_2 TaxID=3073092 RepID=UPI00281656BA|nr:hypothetical protein [Paenibacillus sp. D2_2]WMT41200.1 hypothetical protein RE628_00835 [Paenibacillus sp. D2_2]